METFSLPKVSSKPVMPRVFNVPCVLYERSKENQFCNHGPKHAALEQAFYDWVYDIQNRCKCNFGAIIQKKAQNLASLINQQLNPSFRFMKMFLEGWFHLFKTRWVLKSYNLHGKYGAVDERNSDQEATTSSKKIVRRNLNDHFNCDESVLFYQNSFGQN